MNRVHQLPVTEILFHKSVKPDAHLRKNFQSASPLFIYLSCNHEKILFWGTTVAQYMYVTNVTHIILILEKNYRMFQLDPLFMLEPWKEIVLCDFCSSVHVRHSLWPLFPCTGIWCQGTLGGLMLKCVPPEMYKIWNLCNFAQVSYFSHLSRLVKHDRTITNIEMMNRYVR